MSSGASSPTAKTVAGKQGVRLSVVVVVGILRSSFSFVVRFPFLVRIHLLKFSTAFSRDFRVL